MRPRDGNGRQGNGSRRKTNSPFCSKSAFRAYDETDPSTEFWILPAHQNKALHAAHQRKGSTVYPVFSARMGLRARLPDVARAKGRTASLAASLQLEPTPRRNKTKDTDQPIRIGCEQPHETPHLALRILGPGAQDCPLHRHRSFFGFWRASQRLPSYGFCYGPTIVPTAPEPTPNRLSSLSSN